MRVRTSSFAFDGHRLVYDEYGGDNRLVVLIPGLLLSRLMHRQLAEALAERGNRVVCLDVLGHGESDRPEEMWNYSMTNFGAQALALLDHLGAEAAVVGGTSLGANASLEAAAAAPERVKGLLLEMPVLDNALLGCALAFTPLLVGLTFGAPVARTIAAGASRVPRGLSRLADVGLDCLSQDPKPSASVLQGLFFGRVAPPRELRRRMQQPALVIGHGRDPVHPFSDSDMLVRELPNARLLEASSILELHLTPERLTEEIAGFTRGCFRERRASGSRRRTSVAARRSAPRRG
jgi:pimeloyl-ACP methyl ester carboxylesterase